MNPKIAPILALAVVPALACASPAVEEETSAPTAAAASTPAPAPPPPDALAPATCGAMQKVHELDGVYTAGQPSPEDLHAARAAGIRTVIDLRRADEKRGYDEPAAAAVAGLEYVALPFNGPAELTDAVFERARELLPPAVRPLLLHGAAANRVGAVCIPYRVLDVGLDLEAAVAEARTIGLKTPEYEALARDYVERRMPR
jgi:protein tyrosine phosphatase (PTP) superfamily phosphohydrolase (DUF442 family)